jgi:predicted DNA-binding transcriptional regulator YafY
LCRVFLRCSQSCAPTRLLSLLLLLQHRGRRSAKELADELEVSTRTVLRDIEALSTAGVPCTRSGDDTAASRCYRATRPTSTGLTHDEALALLVAGSRGDGAGMAPALASAMRKVVAGLPAAQRESAGRDAGRILVRDGRWLPLAAPVARDSGATTVRGWGAARGSSGGAPRRAAGW